MKKMSNEELFALSMVIGSDAILLQEKQGQAELTNQQSNIIELPVKSNSRATAEQIYTDFGFTIVGPSEDDLFLKVDVGKWKVKATEHAMWNNLVDSSDNVRAKIFYKAAFYDRDAFVNSPLTRYSINMKYFDLEYSDTYDRINKEPVIFGVMDGQEVIQSFGEKPFTKLYDKSWDDKNHYAWWKEYEQFKESVKNQAEQWLNSNYPDWKNPLACWS